MIKKIGSSFIFRIQPELHNKVKNLSMERGVNMADIVRSAVQEYIEKEGTYGTKKTEMV